MEKGTFVQVQSLDVPADGLVVWLRDFGQALCASDNETKIR
jgi:hypothetical protein